MLVAGGASERQCELCEFARSSLKEREAAVIKLDSIAEKLLALRGEGRKQMPSRRWPNGHAGSGELWSGSLHLFPPSPSRFSGVLDKERPHTGAASLSTTSTSVSLFPTACLYLSHPPPPRLPWPLAPPEHDRAVAFGSPPKSSHVPDTRKSISTP